MLTVVDLLVGLDFVVLDAIRMVVVSCVVDAFDVGTLGTEVVVWSATKILKTIANEEPENNDFSTITFTAYILNSFCKRLKSEFKQNF